MDEGGLWRLFILTGLPEVYLAFRGEQQERVQTQPAIPAFVPEPDQGEMV